MRHRSIAGIALLTASMLFFAGCDDNSSSEESQAANQEKPANVNLPPVPSLELLDIPDQYNDGSHSVVGLLDNKDRFLGEKVKVKALVDEIYVCEPEPEEGEEEAATDSDETVYNAPGCVNPHLFINDTDKSPRTLRVIGYDYRHYEEQLQEGLQYTFTGSYREAGAGFSSSDGLLTIKKIEGNGVEQPEGMDEEE